MSKNYFLFSTFIFSKKLNLFTIALLPKRMNTNQPISMSNNHQIFISHQRIWICSLFINPIKMNFLNWFNVLSVLTMVCQSVYSPPIALQMAYLSAAAYQNPINIEAWNCKYCQPYKINFPKPFFNLTSGVRGFTGYSTSLSKMVVVFKGADNINTFINDLKTARDTYDKCDGCQVSRSFNELYQTVQLTVLNQIESLHKIYRNAGVMIAGHGLGGAFAILAGGDVKTTYGNVDAIYTFGQPRVGNIQFAAYYTKNIPQTYRIINNGDIVPHLPLSQAGFFHSSFEQWYQNNMQTYTTCQGDSSGCSNSLPNSALNVVDNAITNYLNLKVNVQNLDKN